MNKIRDKYQNCNITKEKNHSLKKIIKLLIRKSLGEGLVSRPKIVYF